MFNARQPTIFLIDNEDFLWLWQGWWPQEEGDTDQSTDNRSGEIRWQAERRAAMETTVSYWIAKQKSTGSAEMPSSDGSVDVIDDASSAVQVKGNIVWAGLEPLDFVALFPDWIQRKEDIGQINIQVKYRSTDHRKKN